MLWKEIILLNITMVKNSEEQFSNYNNYFCYYHLLFLSTECIASPGLVYCILFSLDHTCRYNLDLFNNSEKIPVQDSLKWSFPGLVLSSGLFGENKILEETTCDINSSPLP